MPQLHQGIEINPETGHPEISREDATIDPEMDTAPRTIRSVRVEIPSLLFKSDILR
jgi:hypothetical protein